MTDKEFRHMSRGDLVEIIYQYQQREQALQSQVVSLTEELNDRRIKINNAGSLAEAVLSLNHVMETAQAAADQYLDEIRSVHTDATAREKEIIDAANRRADEIILQAQVEASALRKQADTECAELREEAEADCLAMREKIALFLDEHDELRHLLDDL